jgi:long-subunit acyl-CoA synthetase (AMP-forming)
LPALRAAGARCRGLDTVDVFQEKISVSAKNRHEWQRLRVGCGTLHRALRAADQHGPEASSGGPGANG